MLCAFMSRRVYLSVWVGLICENVLANSFNITLRNNSAEIKNSDFKIVGSALSCLSEKWYGFVTAKDSFVLPGKDGQNTLELFFSSPDTSDCDHMELSFQNHYGSFSINFVAHKNWSGVVYIPCLSNGRGRIFEGRMNIAEKYTIDFKAGKNSYSVDIYPKI